MPLYFSHHSPGQVPTLGLIGKVMVGDARLPGWPFGRTLQQRLDLLLNHLIGGKPAGAPPAGFPCLLSAGRSSPGLDLQLLWGSLTSRPEGAIPPDETYLSILFVTVVTCF